VPKKKDHRVVAQGLARGLSQVEAVRQAGYSESTARKKAYQIFRRPLVQSALTVALARQGATLAKIVQPVVDGLGAKVRVTVPGRGRKRPKVYETELPDHEIRLKAHDRAVSLLGGRVRPEEIPDPPVPPCIIHIQEQPDDSALPTRGVPAAIPSQIGGGGQARPGQVVQQQAVVIHVHAEGERPR
jgi:hypothetical protein